MGIDFHGLLLSVPGSIEHLVDDYLAFISQKRVKEGAQHADRHHVLPKSMFGEFRGDPENLVVLPWAKHLEAHYLLSVALPTSPSVAMAYKMMVRVALYRSSPVLTQDMVKQYEASRLLALEASKTCFRMWNRKLRVYEWVPKDSLNFTTHHPTPLRPVPCVEVKTGKRLMRSMDHPDVLSGKVTHINTGMTRARDLLTGEIVHITSDEFAANPTRYEGTNKGMAPENPPNAGRTAILDETGTFRWIPKDTPHLSENIQSGFWVYPFSGKLTVKFASGGPSFCVDVDDPRLETGEIVPQSKGMATVVPQGGGEAFQVPQDDPRIASGELVAHNTGRLRAVDAAGDEHRIYPGDPRLETGELKLKVLKKGQSKLSVYDANGKRWRVYPGDPRLDSGELSLKTVRATRKDKGMPRSW